MHNCNTISSSFTKVPKEVVIQMANKTIAYLKESRNKEYNRKIEALMKKDQRNVFDKLFGKPPKFLLREQADKILRSHNPDSLSSFSEWEWTQMYYANQEIHAKKLLNLAESTPDTYIYVSGDDMWMITGI